MIAEKGRGNLTLFFLFGNGYALDGPIRFEASVLKLTNL